MLFFPKRSAENVSTMPRARFFLLCLPHSRDIRIVMPSGKSCRNCVCTKARSGLFTLFATGIPIPVAGDNNSSYHTSACHRFAAALPYSDNHRLPLPYTLKSSQKQSLSFKYPDYFLFYHNRRSFQCYQHKRTFPPSGFYYLNR